MRLSVSLIFTFIIFYFPFQYKPFSQDSDTLITPLKKITSIHDYIQARKKEQIYDVQPVRDVFHIIDIKLDHFFKSLHFGLVTNIIILLLTQFFLYRVLSFLLQNTKLSFYLSLIYLVHPTTANVYVAFSSKKHILALLFFLIFYNSFLRSKYDFKRIISQSFIFLLSLLSHPIAILLPFWILFQRKYKNFIELIKSNFLLFLNSLIIGILNLNYYRSTFTSQTGFAKNSFTMEIGEKLLIWGRMFFQILAPFQHAPQYNESSPLGLIGLGLVPIFYYLGLKHINKYSFINFTIPPALIFITLYHNGSNIFFLNTYLLIPLVFVLILFGKALNKRVFSNKYYLLLIPLIIISFRDTYSRKSQSYFYDYTSDKEQSCPLVQAAVLASLIESNVEVFKKKSSIWLQTRCRMLNKRLIKYPVFIMTNMIYFDKKLSLQKKSELINKKITGQHDKKLIQIALLYKYHDYGKALSLMKEATQSREKTGSIFYAHPLIFEQIRTVCKKTECIEFIQHIDKMKKTPFLFSIISKN